MEESKTEKIKITVSRTDTPSGLLMRIISLLLYSKEWSIEKKSIEDVLSMSRIDSIGSINFSIQEVDLLNHTVEVRFESENASLDDFYYAIKTVKACFAFILDEQNISMLNKIGDTNASQFIEIFFAPMNKQIVWIESEMDRISKEPTFHLLQAMNMVSEIIPDIKDNDSSYWEKVQPLSEYLDDLDIPVVDEAEEQLHLALGLELEPLETAMSNFMLMTIWLARKINEGEISWQENGQQNIPEIKPLARQVISSTKKHLTRDSRSLDAIFVLRLQRAAYFFLNERERMGEAEHAIATLRSLFKAGYLEIKQEASQKENSIRQRNDGKALEEDVKELLQSMGLKAATTRTTGDGGIDIIAYSDSPLFSGKYVVQCKDWTGSVGEGVIRDLYGVVTAESANKGILITTGTITKSAQKFAEGKPLELIAGEQLSKLLHKFKPS